MNATYILEPAASLTTWLVCKLSMWLETSCYDLVTSPSIFGFSTVAKSIKSTDLLPLTKRAPYTGALFADLKCIFLGEIYSGLKAFSEILLLAIILNIEVGIA
jgi:hypothetical protein